METFITELYRLSENREYSRMQDDMIRDRLVVGIWYSPIDGHLTSTSKEPRKGSDNGKPSANSSTN